MALAGYRGFVQFSSRESVRHAALIIGGAVYFSYKPDKNYPIRVSDLGVLEHNSRCRSR
jgi:hypothetical protein